MLYRNTFYRVTHSWCTLCQQGLHKFLTRSENKSNPFSWPTHKTVDNSQGETECHGLHAVHSVYTQFSYFST